MPRLIYVIFLSSIILLTQFIPASAGWFTQGDDVLFTLDGNEYTAADFRSWWDSWKEPGMSLPESPDLFIDWILLAREAERMNLYEDPEYRKKILTFLKARTLMLLKSEEVDAKIHISDDDLWQKYKEEYTPQYQINILFFHKREDAEKLLDTFGTEPISDEQLEEIVSEKTIPVDVKTNWYRMITVDPGWHPIISALVKGKLSDPVDWRNGVVILRLQEIQEGDRDDFATVREEIYNTLRKKQANELTVELIENLRKKYHVRVDQERLEKLDINAADDSFTDEPIVSMDGGSVSERDFIRQVRSLQNFRNKSGFTDNGDFRYKEQVLNGIINQTLTTREGLARGYEKEPPFKEVFDFYRQHRLIKTLEQRLFVPQIKILPDEVKAYYEEHLETYSRPEIIRMVRIEGNPEDMKALWTEVAMGGDFRTLIQKRFEHPAPVREVPANHLDPEVREVVLKLTKGEVSPVFTNNSRASLVQLVERIPAQPISLAKVGNEIRELLFKEKMDKARREYIDQLRAGSTITVNSEVWKKTRKELEQEDAEKTQE